VSESTVLDAISSMRTEILQGHQSLREELRADLSSLRNHVDTRIDTIERMVRQVTNEHEQLAADGRRRDERLAKLEAELGPLKLLRGEVESLATQLRAIDRNISDADMASRLRDSTQEVETSTVVEAMRLTVDRLTAAQHEAIAKVEASETAAEERERLAAERIAAAESKRLEAEEAAALERQQVLASARSLRKDSWARQAMTVALLVALGLVSECRHHDDDKRPAPTFERDSQ
jgi:hypothetical protein